jgi:PadR family transcriptional regulator PadR
VLAADHCHGLIIPSCHLTSAHNIYNVDVMENSLGQFEQIVIAAILALGERGYGVTIHAKVAELSEPKKVSLGAVYATLDRLEEKRLVGSWLSAPTAARGGRSRRHYRLEKSGEKALRESALTARRLYEAIEKSFGEILWKAKRQIVRQP